MLLAYEDSWSCKFILCQSQNFLTVPSFFTHVTLSGDFMRPSGRANDELRNIRFTRQFTKHAAGSVLVEFGDTKVICTASVENSVPGFLRGRGEGWVTANTACCRAPRIRETIGKRPGASKMAVRLRFSG